jgi:GT2 family glycosyltransferase
MYRPVFLTTDVTEVQSAYTANIAYRADVLAELGGFDATLMSDEDVDLSHRIRTAGHRILFVPGARILHRHHERLRLFVRQVYRRSRNTLRFYRKAGKTPPIFPLPLAWALLAVAGLVLSVTASAWWLASMLVTPPLLYNWWIYRSIRERQVPYLVFPYAQLCVEGAVIAGLFAGEFTTATEGRRHA